MTLVIDRMEIDDAGGDPIKLAEAITKQLPDLSKAIPVREIASAVDIYDIREEALDQIEGGLVTLDDKSIGEILVHRDRPENTKALYHCARARALREPVAQVRQLTRVSMRNARHVARPT